MPSLQLAEKGMVRAGLCFVSSNGMCSHLRGILLIDRFILCTIIKSN
uniref:Uncharacterized protein n=1 Tax=Arundo donax TaxID=35708 RepID=A0A0A9FHT9_ARUDO